MHGAGSFHGMERGLAYWCCACIVQAKCTMSKVRPFVD